MRYFKIILIFFLFLLNETSFANENIVEILKKENNIIFIRHAIAPGNGDPPNFDILDCSTQRNLSKKGELQALKIGEFFKENEIEFTKVLSSEWCRCKDTAKYAFGNFKEFAALNSTFQSPYNKNEGKQLKELYNYVKKWDGKGKNLVLITHYSIITAVSNAVPSSGEIVIADKNFKVLGTIQTD